MPEALTSDRAREARVHARLREIRLRQVRPRRCHVTRVDVVSATCLHLRKKGEDGASLLLARATSDHRIPRLGRVRRADPEDSERQALVRRLSGLKVSRSLVAFKSPVARHSRKGRRAPPLSPQLPPGVSARRLRAGVDSRATRLLLSDRTQVDPACRRRVHRPVQRWELPGSRPGGVTTTGVPRGALLHLRLAVWSRVLAQ